MRGDQILSKEIEMYFRSILEELYEDFGDIPNICLEVAFTYPEQLEKSVEYFISENEIVVKKTGKDVLECFGCCEYRKSRVIFINDAKQAVCYVKTSICSIMIRFLFYPDAELISGIALAFLKKLVIPLQNLAVDMDGLVDFSYNSKDFCCFEKNEYDPMSFLRINPQTKKRKLLLMQCDRQTLLMDSISEILSWRFDLDIHMISMISSARYEGSQAYGSLVKGARGFIRPKRKRPEMSFDSEIDFELSNIRYIRKVLEISDRQVPLLVTFDNKIIGLIKEVMPQECRINFLGTLKWDIFWNGYTIKFRDGMFKIPCSKNEVINFGTNFDISKDNIKRIRCVIQQAVRQTHGTSIILSTRENVIREVDRLCKYNRGIKISPVDLVKHQDFIINLTAIDGAIMIDTECICYGIGMILDGEAMSKGTPSRGARYNSVVNYIKTKEASGEKYSAIIISEDNTVDVV